MTHVAFHASERISDQSKLLVAHSKGVRCNSKACFNAMTGDCHDKLAAMDLSIFNFNNNASLFMFFIIPILLCFVFEHETINTTQVLALFDF